MATQTATTTDRALTAETAAIAIDSRLTAAQRATIRRIVDRRSERMADGETFVSRERGAIVVTVTPEAVVASDEFGRAAYPTIQDVRDAAISAAHREANAVALAAGFTFNYSVTLR